MYPCILFIIVTRAYNLNFKLLLFKIYQPLSEGSRHVLIFFCQGKIGHHYRTLQLSTESADSGAQLLKVGEGEKIRGAIIFKTGDGERSRVATYKGNRGRKDQGRNILKRGEGENIRGAIILKRGEEEKIKGHKF